ncbi:integral membrane protein [Diaporthe helianthi]|uniref:Integral membrane protein n=1 Tax=Diaporthe helianthi TaxID=158607 RepID=A0A2P5HVG0_DIAHE|nr:integral membrane protein [Diaporthe helianthi]
MSDSDETFIGNRLIVFIAFFSPLQLALVLLRFLARRITQRPRGLDDWLVVASLLSQFVQAGISIGALKHGGVGYHEEWLLANHPGLVTGFLKYLLAIATWYFMTCSFGKLAICVFYRTLFPQRSVHIIIYISAGIMICTAIATSIANLAACEPFSAAWGSLEVQAQHCIDKEALYIWASFPSIVTDVVLLVLPLPITWKLHTTKRLKIALTFTFFIGSIGLISSILRFVTFSNNNSFIDATWNAVELIIWTIAEPGIYLIAACLITLRPLLDKYGPKVWPQTSKAQSRGTGATSWVIRSKLSSSTPQNKVAGSRMPSHLSGDNFMASGERGISLSSIRARGDGFEHLLDPDESLRGQPPQVVNNGIRKTVDIGVSWEQATPP